MKHFSRPVIAVLAFGFLFTLAAPLRAQLFDSLQAFGSRLDAGDPSVESTWEWGKEGPKGLASGDFNGDGLPDIAASNLDGTVTVYLNGADGEFSAPIHLNTGTQTLRDIIVADVTVDGGSGLTDAAGRATIQGIRFERRGFSRVRATLDGRSEDVTISAPLTRDIVAEAVQRLDHRTFLPVEESVELALDEPGVVLEVEGRHVIEGMRRPQVFLERDFQL